MLYISSKIVAKLRHQLYGFNIWAENKTKETLDKYLIQLYCRIFAIHLTANEFKYWEDYELDTIKRKSENIQELLKLPLTEDILLSIDQKIKLKSNRNNVLAKLKGNHKDIVFGFILKKPNLLTKRYTGYINTEIFKKCPYC